MGFLVDEKRFLNDNIFKYEERMNSQYSRFLDKNPTFVTYYHISNIESMTDNGFQNVERILGPDSPIRFQEIKDFPVYGLDPILLNLNDEEQGLDTSYEADLIILPNTIKPLPNDCFTINHLSNTYLFMVTEVEYDTIKSNNYYKISFTVKSMSFDIEGQLSQQIADKYTCVLTNIGTQEKCLIRDDDFDLILQLNDIYKDIANKYKALYYNSRYNCFLFNDSVNNVKIYDKYLMKFINDHGLFNERYNYQTLFINADEDPSPLFPVLYEKSLYRIIEKNNKDELTGIKYVRNFIDNTVSIFNYYRDSNVRGIAFSDEGENIYFSDELVEKIKANQKEDENVLNVTIIDYFNNTANNVYGIDLTNLAKFNYLDYSFNQFITIPIVLYILRFYYNKFMSIK